MAHKDYAKDHPLTRPTFAPPKQDQPWIPHHAPRGQAFAVTGSRKV